MRRITRRPSLRENLAASRRGLEHYAALTGRPIPEELSKIADALPAKRTYTKRTEGSSEHAEQCAVIEWWDQQCGVYKLPPFALFAVPNGAHLASGYIGAGKLKREGLRRGALDLILAKPTAKFSGFFLEMKYGKNQPSDEQRAFVGYLLSVGYMAAPFWSGNDAIAAIKDYLA